MTMPLFRFDSTQCTSQKIWWVSYAIYGGKVIKLKMIKWDKIKCNYCL